MHQISHAPRPSTDSLDFVAGLVQKGVTLWVNKGELHYRAPKGLLTSAELQSLHRERSSIASLLGRDPRSQGEIRRRDESRLRRAPLSFMQLSHWHLYGKGYGRSYPIASATRLQGVLCVELVREIVDELVRRHDALRTQIEIRAGSPVQEIATTNHRSLEVVNLEADLPFGRDAAIQNHLARVLVGVHDYAVDPLFRAVLLKLSESDHVLILALDHIISDGYSLSLLSSELWTAYSQRLSGKSIELPNIGMQFPEYALRQRAQSRLLPQAFQVRARRLSRMRFPDEPPRSDAEGRCRYGVSRFLIGVELLFALKEWARAKRTTLVMAVFTAYTAAILRWCEVREAVIKFTISGRMNPDVEHTVGYFAFPLLITVALDKRHRFVDLLKTITEEYCRASDDADFGFSESQLPRPDFTRNATFNWLANTCDPQGTKSEPMGNAIRRSRFDFVYPQVETDGLDLDYDPLMVLSEREEGILCEIHFSHRTVSALAVERFERLMIDTIVAMLRDPGRCVADLENQ